MTDNPLWYKDAIFYEIFVRAFCDSNGDGDGDLPGLTSQLDYLQALGIDCLWLLPIYPSPMRDDGYGVVDYYNVQPSYGTLNDFRDFLREAHARGLRVIMDLVLNHTSIEHPWFKAARADRNSPYRDYYVWSDTDQKYRQARIVFLHNQPSNWTWDPEAGQYYLHRFYGGQADLNYDNPAVRAEMLNVVHFWLKQGVDGFRLDAAAYLVEREGTPSEGLPETHAFLKQVRRLIDERYPGRILLAEANLPPNELVEFFGDGDECHLAFHFPLMPRVFTALAQGEAGPIIAVLRGMPPIPAEAQWCTFLRSHDDLTIEKVTDVEREYLWAEYAPEPQMRLNLGIRRRLAPLLDGDPRKIRLAFALLCALPGSPCVYYGDEIGMGDNTWLVDRDGLRTPMQWDASPNAGFSTAQPEQLFLPVIDEGPYGYQRVNVAAQRADPNSLWHALRRLLSVHKAHRALAWGETEVIPLPTTAVLGLLRRYGDEALVLLHNLSPTAQPLTVDLARFPAPAESWAGTAGHDTLAEPEAAAVYPYPITLTLEPYGYAWLAVRQPAGPPDVSAP